MELNERIQAIAKMTDDSVIGSITDKNPLICVRAICETVIRRIKSKEAINAIRNLKQDDRVFWIQYNVGMFAEAALAILGVEEYRGESWEVRNLIISNMNFF